MTNRVALFFDGKNFYRALDGYKPTMGIDYDKLATWVVSQVAGERGVYVGAHYYTGHRPAHKGKGGPGRRLGGFLTNLSYQLGYFIKREPLVTRKTTCKACKKVHYFNTEKRVDVRLAAEMIQFAAVGSYDMAVLLSGDQDFIPAVEAVQRLGKQVFVATWNRRGLSPDLRRQCFGEVNLAEGETVFSTGQIRVSRREHARRDSVELSGVGVTALTVETDSPTAEAEVTAEATLTEAVSVDGRGRDLEMERLVQAVYLDLIDADAKFSGTGGYVAVWFFCHRWKSQHEAPTGPGHRKEILQVLIDAGHAERYERVNARGFPDEALRPIGGNGGELLTPTE